MFNRLLPHDACGHAYVCDHVYANVCAYDLRSGDGHDAPCVLQQFQTYHFILQKLMQN